MTSPNGTSQAQSPYISLTNTPCLPVSVHGVQQGDMSIGKIHNKYSKDT